MSPIDAESKKRLKIHAAIGVSVFLLLTFFSIVFIGPDKWQPLMMLLYVLIGGGIFAISRAVRLAVDKPKDEQILETTESVKVVEQRIEPL